jgi:hypothetical protein
VRTIAGFVAGLAATLVGWLLVMPWDLSEGTSGEDSEADLLWLLCIVVVGVLVTSLWRPTDARWFAIGAWTGTLGLFFWRNAASDTDGLWLVALILMAPALAAGLAVAHAAGRRAHERVARSGRG